MGVGGSNPLTDTMLGWSNGKMQVSKTLRWGFESLTLRLPSQLSGPEQSATNRCVAGSNPAEGVDTAGALPYTTQVVEISP